jgi:hypothetical protein
VNVHAPAFKSECKNVYKNAVKIEFSKSGGVAELANASTVHPRDLGSNLSTERRYLTILFV